jgi:hypothetical protein
VASEFKPSATQECADSLEVARLIAEGKKVTDPELRRRIRVREDYRNAIHELLAPELFTIECAYHESSRKPPASQEIAYRS